MKLYPFSAKWAAMALTTAALSWDAAAPGAFAQNAAASASTSASKEQAVALRAYNGEYVGTVAKGGLRANSKTITGKQVFQLIDLKDGGFADGDEVRIKETNAGSKPTYWMETPDNELTRVADADDYCTFKLKKDGSKVQFLSKGGKFVGVDNRGMVLVDESGKTTSFELILNPEPSSGGGVSKPAATEEAAKAEHTPVTNVVPAASASPRP